MCLSLIAIPSQQAHAADTPDGGIVTTPDDADASPSAVAPVTENLPSATTPPAPEPAVLTPTPTSAIVLPTETAPKTEILHRRPRIGLLTAGLVLFVTGWVSDIGFTYGYDHQPASTSFIPIVGPFIQMTQHYGLDGPPVDTGSSDADARINKNLDTANSTIRALAITGATISAVVQILGLALTIAGAVTKRKITRYALGQGGLAAHF